MEINDAYFMRYKISVSQYLQSALPHAECYASVSIIVIIITF
jgi:hypothetical protein